MRAVYITCVSVAFLTLAGHVVAKEVTLTWDASQETDIDHYEVWFAPWIEVQKTGAFQKDADVPVGTTEYTVEDLDEGTYYVFQVYAVNDQGVFSYASNIATDQKRVIPATVTGVKVGP